MNAHDGSGAAPATASGTDGLRAAADPLVRIAWLQAGRARAHRSVIGRFLWRVLITVLGALVVLLGIVLIPLPGPGWLIVFGGIGLWATEYVWASRLLRWTKRTVIDVTKWMTTLPTWTKVGAGIVVAGLVVAAVMLWRAVR